MTTTLGDGIYMGYMGDTWDTWEIHQGRRVCLPVASNLMSNKNQLELKKITAKIELQEK